MGLLEVTRTFNSQDQCERYLDKARWPEGVNCPRCGGKDPYRLRSVKKFECSKCGHQFSTTSGTIFHKTYLPLPKWFLAIYLMCSTGQNVSVNRIHAAVGLPYKTAWYMHQRIRRALKEPDFKRFCTTFLGTVVKSRG